MKVNYIENKLFENRTEKSHVEVPEKILEEFARRIKEQMAKEGEAGEDKDSDKSAPDFHREMLAYYERVQEQIKNGPPKFRIGGAEMSEEEWEKLIEKVDANLDAVKEEQEKRMAQQEEEAEELAQCRQEQIAKLFEERDSDTGQSRILTKADGTKVLAVTREVGGTEFTSYLKIDDNAWQLL